MSTYVIQVNVKSGQKQYILNAALSTLTYSKSEYTFHLIKKNSWHVHNASQVFNYDAFQASTMANTVLHTLYLQRGILVNK